MTYQEMLAFLLLAVIWVLAIYLTARYAAGYGARSVVCPHLQKRATISTFWATRRGVSACDVLQCSLLPGGKPVTCDKGCVVQL